MNSVWRMVLGTVGLAGAAMCAWRLHRRELPALRALDGEFQLPDMRFRYTPEALFDTFERIGREGRALLRRSWAVGAGLALLLPAVMAAAAHNSVGLAPLVLGMDAAACLRTVADLAEKALLARTLNAYPDKRRIRAARAASAITAVKWCLTALWVAALFVGLVLRAAQI